MNTIWSSKAVCGLKDFLQTEGSGNPFYPPNNDASTSNEPDGVPPSWQNEDLATSVWAIPVDSGNPNNFAIGGFNASPIPLGFTLQEFNFLRLQVRAFQATCTLPCGDLTDINDAGNPEYDAAFDQWRRWTWGGGVLGIFHQLTGKTGPGTGGVLTFGTYPLNADLAFNWPWKHSDASDAYNFNSRGDFTFFFEDNFWFPINFTAQGDDGGLDGSAWTAWTADFDADGLGLTPIGTLTILGQTVPIYGNNCAGDITMTAKTLWTDF